MSSNSFLDLLGYMDIYFFTSYVDILNEHFSDCFVPEEFIRLPTKCLDNAIYILLLVLGKNGDRLTDLNLISINLSSEFYRYVEYFLVC
jgi:hypothetical protein